MKLLEERNFECKYFEEWGDLTIEVYKTIVYFTFKPYNWEYPRWREKRKRHKGFNAIMEFWHLDMPGICNKRLV